MFLVLLSFCAVLFVESSDWHETGESSRLILPDPLSKFKSVDYSKATPSLKLHERVMDLMNGELFDDILRDTPDGMRPPSVVAFWNSFDTKCSLQYQQMDFEDAVPLSRGTLYAGKYDMGSAPIRTWYKFIPERDLQKRFGVTECPSLVFVPPQCNGFTQWCVNNTESGITYLGCDDFVDQCTGTQIWTVGDGGFGPENWLPWLLDQVDAHPKPQLGTILRGIDTREFKSMSEQQRWLLSRDRSTVRESLRGNFVSAALPAFSDVGYKAVQMPEAMMREILNFYARHKSDGKSEGWNSDGQTAVNGHEVSPFMTSLDLEYQFRDRIANQYIKPLLEEWVGFPLELTSHYGLREYYSGSWLKNHIDRIDVLIISCTNSYAQFVAGESVDSGWPEGISWPLEGVDFHGNNVRYNHPPGTMILYESAKFIHGRPYPLPANPDPDGPPLVHLGSFAHFRPADGSWDRIGHAGNARGNMNQRTTGGNYHDNPPYYPQKSQPKQEL